jgi:cell division protein FtsZ
MSGAGSALMGIGTARGDDRAVAAAEAAISSPLLEASIDGAHGVLLSIQGGSDLGLFEINEAAQLVANSAAPDANIIFGAVIDDALGDEVRVTVIAAGFDEPDGTRPRARTAAYPGPGHAPAPVPAPSQWRSFSLGEQQPGLVAPAVTVAEPAGQAAADATTGEATRATEASGSGDTGPAADQAKVDGVPPPRSGAGDAPPAKPRPAGNGRPADGAGTRRKSVVFEEDDELDVPDFLK